MPHNCQICYPLVSNGHAHLYAQNGTGRELWLCGFHHNLLELLGWEKFKGKYMLEEMLKKAVK